mmetsp:Transcript_23085/g.53272  ORF Transcript_23085/g.53272 Transcript_23085/m.53272 type:complete len:274 (+) Transcript_23085:448-1269(+)
MRIHTHAPSLKRSSTSTHNLRRGVLLHLLLELRHSEHRREARADEVRDQVAVLDLVGGPHGRPKKAQQRGEPDVDHKAHDAPLVQHRGADHEDDGGEVHPLHDRAPDPARSLPVPSVERPPPHLLDDASDPDARGHDGQKQALPPRKGHDEDLELLPVLADHSRLLAAQQHKGLRAPEEDEGVGQARDHRCGLQRLQRAVAVRHVPARRQQRARGGALCEGPEDALRDGGIRVAVRGDDVHDEGPGVRRRHKVEHQGHHAHHAEHVREPPRAV